MPDSKSFLLQSPHGTNNLSAVKTNSKGDVLRIPKPPKAPEKPLMPYMRYSRKVWEQVKNSNPHLKLWEVGKIIGQMWRELPEEEKTLYVEEYDAEKAQHNEAMRQYQRSPAYQAWLVAKEREKTMEEEQERNKATSLRSRDRPGDIPQGDLRESYILEDNEEDTEDQYTAKHVAAARFQRNHRLMQEIFSDSRLPDPGQLITQSRLNSLRIQVEQLKNHKRNLCQEIDNCELRHQSKIKRIQNDSNNFFVEYHKLTSNRPMITESQFADMIVKAKHDMQREEEERIARYMAEVEIRRRKQQQQRQREAELAAEAERRRQQQHMRPHPAMSQLNESTAAVFQPDERVSSDNRHNDPKCDSPQSTSKLVVNGKLGTKTTENVPQNVASQYAPGVMLPGTAFSQPVPSPTVTGQRFSQASHTQHHYPPVSYPPNPMSPQGQSMMMQHPRMQHQTGTIPVGLGKPLTNMGATKSTPAASSTSSTSSNSSASSTSSKKKRSDAGKKKSSDVLSVCGNAVVGLDRRVPGIGEGAPEPMKSPETPSSNDRPPSSGGMSSVQHRQQLPSQHYLQGPQQSAPPQGVPSHLMGGTQQVPFGYDQGMPPGSSVPSSAYYHSSPMSHPSNYAPHTRPPFVQHGPYGSVQYPPHQQQPQSSASEHPLGPPLYVQHLSQQPHMGQPGPPMMGSPPHSANHPQPHSHQNPIVGWHQGNPAGYPTHYGGPRYPGAGAPVGYASQAVRHLPPGPGVYAIPPHHQASGQHPQQTGPPSHMPEGSCGPGPQQIPAPPPYQQHHQTSNMHTTGYWPGPHQVASEYGPNPISHQYLPSSHPEVPIPPSAPAEATGNIVHPHGEVSSQQPLQSHAPATYYPGYNHPSMPASYGQPTNMGSSGFYVVPPQQQSGPYPPPTHGPHGNWPGYPPHMAGQPAQHGIAYPTQQPHHHQPGMPSATSTVPQPGMMKTESMNAVEGGAGVQVHTSNRPPSVSG